MKKYLTLTKPGIIFGNGISVVAGYFLGSRGAFEPVVFFGALVGISLVIACGCVLNNAIDRDIDRLMERTKERALAKGTVSVRVALAYALALGALGFATLALTTGWLTVAAAAFGLLVYVGLYSLWLKRASIHGTAIGSLSGAIPPLVGYCAATGRLDLPAGLLVLTLCFWQMPHSYAIGIFRSTDFRRAGLPLLPLLRTAPHTKVIMLLYTVAFLVSALLLEVLGYTGIAYGIAVGVAGLLWVTLVLAGFWVHDDARWAKQVFASSIVMVTILSLSLTLSAPV